jgi:hypothetical protein
MRLIIYENRFVFEKEDGDETFYEGIQSKEAQKRAAYIKTQLENDYLTNLIKEQMISTNEVLILPESSKKALEELVNSVTSEVGRAIIGLTFMQLAIKAIAPKQSIRLHKGGKSKRDFSWTEGVSMRTLDKAFVTPILRQFGLLSLNADGFMMTRSLAENYPYSAFYKAAVRGAKLQWLTIVEHLESNELEAEIGLKYFVRLLANRTAKFNHLANEAVLKVDVFVKEKTKSELIDFVFEYVSYDDYSARLFEIAIHSAFQVLDEKHLLDGELKPLSQMRSANKKHKNIGDIEVEYKAGSRMITEAWDTKFDKTNLREEIEELYEKLVDQPECKVAGFISNQEPLINDAISNRIEEIEDALGDVSIKLLSFKSFIQDEIAPRFEGKDDWEKWVKFFVECIAQKRRYHAPIDEPCQEWLDRINRKMS